MEIGVSSVCLVRNEGASAIEFAIVAPVFFMLVFGIIVSWLLLRRAEHAEPRRL
jgi:Flp pilus assembly protein TadG